MMYVATDNYIMLCMYVQYVASYFNLQIQSCFVELKFDLQPSYVAATYYLAIPYLAYSYTKHIASYIIIS